MSDATRQYLRNAVLTAPPEQLQLMLYDGAIRFAMQAREALEAHDIEKSHELLLRTQKIVLELYNGLRPEIDRELCTQMGGLYMFVHRKLVEANVSRSVSAVDEALQILRHVRETWTMLIGKLRAERGAAASPAVDAQAPQRKAPARVAPGGRPVPHAAAAATAPVAFDAEG